MAFGFLNCFFFFLIGSNRKFTGSLHTPWTLNLKKACWFRSSGFQCFPGGANGKEPTCQCRRSRDAGLIPALGRNFFSLEKKLAIWSSIHAWKIPWTDEPGRIQSMEMERVRNNWAWACVHTHTHKCTHTYTLLSFAYPAQIFFRICAFSRHFIPGNHRWLFKWQFWH